MSVHVQSYTTLLQPHRLKPTRLRCPWNLPARILEWVAISCSRDSSRSRDGSWVSCTAGKFFTTGPLGKLGHCETIAKIRCLYSWLTCYCFVGVLASSCAGWRPSGAYLYVLADQPQIIWTLQQVSWHQCITITNQLWFAYIYSLISADYSPLQPSPIPFVKFLCLE